MTAEPAKRPARRRRPTATSAFGVGRRESHDASVFYGRFQAPVLTDDDDVVPPRVVDEVLLGDAREVLATDKYVLDGSVALMVTSPPYYAGKAYEEALGTGHIPGSYKDYLGMLRDVFAAVVPKLEPGGRLAVNVANLGRKPYRSLAADVIHILQDDLRLLLRGEIVWQKAVGASGSCAWGSFQSAHNPVLRDVTERVIVASKGRFDRAVEPLEREARGLPHRMSIDADRFMDATIDLWELPPESATRVDHPAPFPVSLPQTLIELYTYEGDLVLDPFMGSGSTAIAALRSRRHFLGVDTDEGYARAARARVQAELDARSAAAERERVRVDRPGRRRSPAPDESPLAHALRQGRAAKDVAKLLLEHCGFHDIDDRRKLAPGIPVDLAARDGYGREWLFDLSAAGNGVRGALRRTDAVWKAVGKAAVCAPDERYVVLTGDRQGRSSGAERAVRAALASGVVFDVLELRAPVTVERLRAHATATDPVRPARPFGE